MENLPLGVIARYPLSDRLERYEVVLTRNAMRFFPGASTPVHSRPLPNDGTAVSFAEQTQWQLPLSSTTDMELRLVRLTLPVGARAEAQTHSGQGLMYVIEGVVTISGPSTRPQTHWAGDLFHDPNNAELTFNNASGTAPTKLLLYHVTKKGD